MSKLLARLLGFLFPRVDGGDPGDAGDTGADLDTGDRGGAVDLGSDDLDDGIDDLDDDAGSAPVARRAAPVDDTHNRVARLEAELEAVRRTQPAPQAPNVDPEWQREEERLRAADVTDIEKWQIQANRTLRANQQAAQQALFQAQDTNDRAAFTSKFSSDPRRAKYADRVEKQLSEMRAKGQNVPRELLYYTMLGKDVAEGKLKSKPRSAPPADMPRGRTPNARADVGGRGTGKTEHQKRADRLANINI